MAKVGALSGRRLSSQPRTRADIMQERERRRREEERERKRREQRKPKGKGGFEKATGGFKAKGGRGFTSKDRF